jgi:Tfp pilus assembly protein PilX
MLLAQTTPVAGGFVVNSHFDDKFESSFGYDKNTSSKILNRLPLVGNANDSIVPQLEYLKMNQQQHPNQRLIQFILRAQQLNIRADRSEQGYAMVLISILSIVLFSLLAATLTIANLTKLSTNAYVDGTNTFYAAESGLNKRANDLREKFAISLLPTAGSATTPASISDCFSIIVADTASVNSYDINNDFGCRNYRFKYGNNSTTLKSANGRTETTDKVDQIDYIAYTSVKPNQDYATIQPLPQTISPGEPFAGLNALEYKYTVSATAKKIDAIQSSGNATTVLQMDFKSRVVPLFQFAAFYEDDLEMDSQMPMSISGPIHTNGNLRGISYSIYNDASVKGQTSATFSPTNLIAGTQLLGKVTAAGSIYERVASSTWRPESCGTTINCGVMAVYKGGVLPLNERTSYYYFPDFNSGTERTSPLTPTEINGFSNRMQDSTKGVARLNPPKPGFLRETTYKTPTETGLYYAKADLRLKFYPNRSMPFDLTSIQAGSGCNLTTNKIPVDRQGSATLSCISLTKGQLRSLQQPVVTKSTLTTTGTQRENILKALRVAIAASSKIVPLSKLDQATDSFTTLKATRSWVSTFETLLKDIPGYESGTGDTARTALLAQTPKKMVEDFGSKFLAAPIQAVGTAASSPSAYNPSASTPLPDYTTADADGNVDFCNSLKSPGQTTSSCTQMQLLQTNIASLTYWNRDGVYVEADAGNKDVMTTPYAAPAMITLGLGLSTDNKAFIKAAADPSKPVTSFAYNGLAAVDRTERGLVIHGTVSYDTDGDGIDNTTATDTNKITGKKADGSVIPHVDNYRIYTSGGAIRKSTYGFVWSGGEELPAPLTIATDQAAYIQGDYNNPGVVRGSIDKATSYKPSNDTPTTGNPNPPGYYRQPASIIADTITVLSNKCENDNKQVNCGILDGTDNSKPQVSNGIAINAAFLSNLIKSGGTQPTYNGGLNKYMRLLENWSGPSGTPTANRTYYSYTGSMVSLGEPLESDKMPDGAGVPNRNFNYETRFDAFEKLPPLTPSAIYLQQDVFRRNY